MKINSPIMLITMLCVAISSCIPSAPEQSTTRPTPTLRPRPLTEYDLGIWHYQIAAIITEKGSNILDNLGHEGIDFEIEILPSTSLQDEVIIIKYDNWPESAGLGQVWYWLFATIETESRRYKLDPKAVITAEFKTKPYGDILYENKNLKGFCEIPWDSVTTYASSGGVEVYDVKQFLDTWQCYYQ